jgi:hypothetical protein
MVRNRPAPAKAAPNNGMHLTASLKARFYKKGIVMKTFMLVLLAASVLTNSTILAQDESIQFPAGSNSATIKGHTNPLSSKSYRLSVSANQRVVIHLTSTSRKKLVRFDVKRDKYRGKPLPGSGGVTDWEGVLQEGGDYWISVYALPTAGEEDFTLEVTLK